MLLAVSLYFLLQLTPASNPRQLFAKDTNLQQMLDLAANTSDSGIRCDKCSGFYGVRIFLLYFFTLVSRCFIQPFNTKVKMARMSV